MAAKVDTTHSTGLLVVRCRAKHERLDVLNVPVFGTRTDGCPYVVRPSAYALVRNQAGQLAVIQTSRGCFLPGGGVEGEETPVQTVEREAKEECGLVLVPRQVVGHAIEIVYSAEERTCFEKPSVFIAADPGDQTTSTEPDHALVWLFPDEALDTLSPESHQWAVRCFTGAS